MHSQPRDKIYENAPKGANYTVTGKSGSFYKINYGGRTGYVYSYYMSVAFAAPAPSPAPTPTSTPAPIPTQTPAPVTPVPAPQEGEKKVIAGYYASWSAYSGYTPGKIPAGVTHISYDDDKSIAEKAKYIKETGLGGAAIWELSQNADGRLAGVISSNIE